MWTHRADQLLKSTTSSNVSALNPSFLVCKHIAEAKKLFSTGEELILPAAKETCCGPVGEAAVQLDKLIT